MTKLTATQIEEIRERFEDATPGTWFVEDYLVKTTLECNESELPIEIADSWHAEEDAKFIANARQDIPALLAHIAELEKQNGKYSEVLSELEYRINKYSIHSLEDTIEGWDVDAES